MPSLSSLLQTTRLQLWLLRNAQGDDVTQVFWWDTYAGSWDFWLVDIQYGTNFPIELGQGYLLNTSTAATWTYYAAHTRYSTEAVMCSLSINAFHRYRVHISHRQE